ELSGVLLEPPRGANRGDWTLEGRHQAVPGAVDDSPGMGGNCQVGAEAVVRKQLGPALVAELCGARRRADDVAQEDRPHLPWLTPGGSHAGDEVLDLGAERLDAAEPRRVRRSPQLDEAGTGNPLGEVTPRRARGHRVVRAVDDECRRPNRPEQSAYVDL